MKEYPSISRDVINGEKIYAFNKIDGSSARSEWNKKRGFYKFGTRTQLIDEKDQLWGEIPTIIRTKYEKDLNEIFIKNRWERVICFFEFWGKNSFAGRHQQEPHDVTLFDVSVHKKGILLPQDYLKIVGHLDIAKLLYYGNANSELVEKVKNRTLEGMGAEGVVCKGAYISPGMPLMFKIKSNDWLTKLKNFCSGDDKLYNQLV